MPFVARHATTHERIDITRLANPRRQLDAAQLVCQLCDTRMFIRQGPVIRAHFAHAKACPVDYQCHPESPEHLLGKFYISRYLAQLPEFAGARVDLEVPIHARKRVADIMVTFPKGHRLAVEIQLASITTEQLEARTGDYQYEGIDVLWVLGKAAALSVHNQAWCRTVLGGYLSVVFTECNEQVDIALVPEGAPHEDGDAQPRNGGGAPADPDHAPAVAG